MTKGIRLLLLGPSGCGKGTQGKLLEQVFAIPHLSAGDILRSEVKANTPLGCQAKQVMERGDLVQDTLIIEMIERRLTMPDCERGYILDGFPRTVGQARAFDVLLKKRQVELLAAILLELVDDEIVRRLSERLMCTNCGMSFHATGRRPRKKNICDRCGEILTRREDDAEETVRARLMVYRRETVPLVDHYEKQGLLVRIAGAKAVDEVHREICSVIEGHRKAQDK